MRGIFFILKILQILQILLANPAVERLANYKKIERIANYKKKEKK